MKIGVVIAEYNPFHNGHKYQLDDFRKNCDLDSVIVIMSGNFVQRGEPAICDKRERAKWAIMGGADMVVELPSFYACANASAFARGAISTVKGIADYIGFGAETDDIELLKEAALINVDCVRNTSQGKSYPREIYEWIAANYPKTISELYKKPNCTLAFEYIRAANEISPNVKLYATKRIGAEHDSDTAVNDFASATKLREMIVSGLNISRYVPEYVKINKFITLKDIEKIILYKLRMMSVDELSQIADVNEGLEFLLKREIFNCTDIKGFLSLIKSKRYTMARLKRICISAVNGFTNELVYSEPKYIHVLAVRSDSRNKLFAEISKRSELKIIAKATDYKNAKSDVICMTNIDNQSSDLFSLFYNDYPKKDYTNKLLII